MKKLIIHRISKRVILAIIILIHCACDQQTEIENIDIIKALSNQKNRDCFETAKEYTSIDPLNDSGPHDAFQTEWWYYTGNLKSNQGRHFGYQLTFFRHALSCESKDDGSKWRTSQMYFAHFAVTDTHHTRFYADTRTNRSSIGIAGAKASPFEVWIDNWRVKAEDSALLLMAKSDNMSIEFELLPVKPPVLQGKKGYSQKGKKQSNASYYYSLPRLITNGKLSIASDTYTVEGYSWFDHEWSTSTLSDHVRGWDWFYVHLNDGRDLMVCQVRDKEGLPNGFSFGCLSFKDGNYTILNNGSFSITVNNFWESPKTRRKYPSEWAIAIPHHNLYMNAIPVIKNQEHTHAFTYWEGAVSFNGEGVSGYGYVEMTGY